ncbi:hypothetical protein RCL1_001952 [Eukaryota sp. TZLM3-RCL]
MEIPARELISLNFTFKKLQNKLVKFFEEMDYSVRLSLAKMNNPAFANFLIDVMDSSATALFTQIPHVYGLLLNDHQLVSAMCLHCFLWPNNFRELVSQRLTFHHLLNCKYVITYCLVLHNGLRDQIHAMCKSHKVESFLEPLLRKLAENEDDDSSGQHRTDVIIPSSNGRLHVVDVVTVDVCKSTADKSCFSETSLLDNAEQGKRLKYEKPLSNVKSVHHVKYELCPFAVSLIGNLGKSVINLLQDFKVLVSGRHHKHFDSKFWTNRLVFTIFKMVPLVVSRSLEAVSVILESKACVRLDDSKVLLK